MNIFMELGFEKYYTQYPLVLVDVGASGGLESDWKPAKKYLQIIGFEPDKREFPNLERKENGNIKYFNIGLFNKKATLDYFLTEKQQTSSMLKPNGEFIKKFPESERFNIVKKITVETDTIDSQFQSHHIDDVDFIKLDTQGSELSILEGAQATIKDHVFGLEIEVEFSELYQGQPLFSDIDSFVRKKGFQLFDIQGHYWKRTSGKNRYKKRGQLIFGDALYLRKAEDFSGMIGMMPNEEERNGKFLKALTICFLYGYFDYAVELFEMNAGVFNKDERSYIERYIKHSSRWENNIPSFKGQRMIADMVHSLWEIIRPTHNSWATSDRKIGNI